MVIKPRTIKLMAVLLLIASYQVNAQCVLSIGGLLDTIHVCRNTTLTLNPTFIFTGGTAVPTDTTWTPATGLSNPHALNPVVTIGTSPIQYNLSVTSITTQNFVDNGDFSQGNTGFTSSYIDTNGPGSLYPEGHYSIVTNPSSVHPAFASFGDHTTGTGNMMVINGAGSPVNIWCQTITVTPNTQYDFSAWGASTTPSNPAQLQFEIDGTLVGTSLQLPSTNGLWTEFHVVWFSGSSTSITICIHDQQTALSGNDFAIDDISFRQICTATDSIYIGVDNIVPSINKFIKLGCEADTVVFTSGSTGTHPDHYKWQFGDGNIDTTANPVHIYTTQGVYNIRLDEWTNHNCGDSATTSIDTRHTVTIGFTVDQDTICATQAIQFTSSDAVTVGPATYFWDFGDGSNDFTASPSHTYNNAGIYTVTHIVTDKVPCSDTLKKQVVVLGNPTIALTMSDSVICPGKEIDFAGTLYLGYDSVKWNFGDGSLINNVNPVRHAFDRAGYYTVNVMATYLHCPPVSASTNVQVFDLPRVNIGRDTSMCPWSSPIPLFNYEIDTIAANYLWSNGSTGSSISADKPGLYWLKATNQSGCSVTDSMEVVRSCWLDIPNAFTPNGDGVNDYFFPRQLFSRQLTKFHMDIYDRWGQLIFTTDNIEGRGWDGKFNGQAQPAGVYIYLIEATPDQMGEEKVHGNVTLIR